MSKFLTFDELAISDQDLLVAALGEDMTFRGSRKGATVESYESPQHLFGVGGDQRLETAEVIVRRQFVGGAANDLGFKRQESGNFRPIISAYDRAFYNASWLDELSQRYGERRFIQEMYESGYILSNKVPAVDGATEMSFVVMGAI